MIAHDHEDRPRNRLDLFWPKSDKPELCPLEQEIDEALAIRDQPTLPQGLLDDINQLITGYTDAVREVLLREIEAMCQRYGIDGRISIIGTYPQVSIEPDAEEEE